MREASQYSVRDILSLALVSYAQDAIYRQEEERMQIFGSQCWLCWQRLHFSHHGICSFCFGNLPRVPAYCSRCGLTLSRLDITCEHCLNSLPCWQTITFVSNYKPPLSTLIKKMKFHAFTQLAPVLARLLLLRWLEAWHSGRVKKPQRIISVPLHARRSWQRGFNQSDLLARPLAHWLGCDYQCAILKRIHTTPPQLQLSAADRRENLHGAFYCNYNVKGQHVALIDDVVTTGSTANEIGQLLLAQGVASLQVLCVCRTE